MTIRELQPTFDDDLLEPETALERITHKRMQIPKLSLSMNSIDDYKALVRPLGQLLMGVLLIWFGAINTGSAFTQATHFSGTLSTIFYTYQAGTIMIMIGGILIYDGVKRTGYI